MGGSEGVVAFCFLVFILVIAGCFLYAVLEQENGQNPPLQSVKKRYSQEDITDIALDSFKRENDFNLLKDAVLKSGAGEKTIIGDEIFLVINDMMTSYSITRNAWIEQ
jgi:hypothetical protein